jgi:hypothetical protein
MRDPAVSEAPILSAGPVFLIFTSFADRASSVFWFFFFFFVRGGSCLIA